MTPGPAHPRPALRGLQPPINPPPPHPSPPPPPERALSGRRVLRLVVAGLAAMLSLGLCTARYVAGVVHTPPDTTGAELAVAWALPFDTELNRRDYTAGDLYAAWLSGDTIVRAQADGVRAYRLADGAAVWASPVPRGSSLCAAAHDLRGTRTVIAYGPSTGCDTIAGLDTTTGTYTWTATIPVADNKGHTALNAPHLVTAGDAVAVRVGRDWLAGYHLADGKPVWKLDLKPQDCAIADVRGSHDRFVFAQTCALAGGSTITALQPDTGRPLWQRPLATGRQVGYILSAVPLVTGPAIGNTGFASFGDAGQPLASFTSTLADTDLEDLPVNDSPTVNGQGVYPHQATADTVYLTGHRTHDADYAARIVAVDLHTGQPRWVTTGYTTGAITMISADGQSVLAWQSATTSRLIRIDARTGAATALARTRFQTDTQAIVVERNGTVVVVPWKHAGSQHAILVLRPR
jgi:outer membrane protein assembly factor BamB